jgi:hypothetical protein
MDSCRIAFISISGHSESLKWAAGWTLFIMILAGGFWFVPTCATADEDAQHLFSTWEGFEVDKCASIWLIKKFVDKDAVFRFFPKGETIHTGTPFDTPDAQLRRYHNRSTFESILLRYGLVDEKLVYVGRIVHDVEINIWQKKAMPETLSVQEMVNSIIKNSNSNEEVIEKSSEYFDALYRKALPGSQSP